MINFILIIIAFFFVLLNAFFVAAEFGMVKMRHTRVQAIKKMYGFRGRILETIHKNLDAYLSACQLGITLASLALGWIGEPAFAHLIRPIFQLFGIENEAFISFMAIFIAFSVISFLHIVIGELMPKSLAIRQAEKVSLWTAVPLYLFYWLMYPAILLLNSCSNALLKLSGLGQSSLHDHIYSPEEIKLILHSSHLYGGLSDEQVDMMEHVLDFSELIVTEVMRPQNEMVKIDRQAPIEQIMAMVMEHRYSRYPVFDAEKNRIVGIIHIKDLFEALYKKGDIKEIDSMIRPILQVSRKMPVSDLLSQFRKNAPHFALIYNQRHECIGFVTLDNLLQVLIGRIKDEFHLTRQDWVKQPDGSLILKGDCSIYALERALDIDIELSEEEDEMDTVAGLIIHRLQTLPKAGSKIEFPHFHAVVSKVKGTRILEIKVYPKELVKL